MLMSLMLGSVLLASDPKEKSPKGETLIELIEKAESVPVYLMPGVLSVKTSISGMLPASCTTLQIPDEDLGNAYVSAQKSVVDELNKVFGVSKFTAGDISSVPTKTVTVLGNTGEIQDWAKTSETLIVILTVSGTYSFFPGDGKVQTTYTVAGNAKFAEITSAQQPLSYVNALGTGFSADNDFDIEGDCFDSMDKYKEKIDPTSLVDDLNAQVGGSFDNFYEKQKKKYDKAMKKKK